LSTLTAVIPVFNQRDELSRTLDALDDAIAASPFDASIVVVDDGSTDGSADAALRWSGSTQLEVIQQQNAGRFVARRRGIEASTSDYCLLIDSRVVIAPGALAFVARQLEEDSQKEVWTAHVEIEATTPFGTFWDVLTRRAFSAYFDDPRTTSFGVDAFDEYPKGTTCFFGPRELLRTAFDAFRTPYSDLRHANDDTPLIRWIAARTPINISPSYSCRYGPRERLRPFLRHAFHRGVVFVDGHGRRESRLYPLTVAFFPSTLAWLAASWFVPELLAAPLVAAGVAGAALAFLDRRPRAATTMAWVTPLYAVAHGAGMWRGLALAARATTSRQRLSLP